MSDVLIDRPELASLGQYEFGWSDSDAAGATARRGVNDEVVTGISALKNEPEWMLKNRLKALKLFGMKPMPTWGADLSGIDFDNIKYFVRSTEKQAHELGRPPRRHQDHLREARHPRGGAQAPRRRRRRPVRVRGRLPPDPRGPRGPGRHLHGHRHGAARAPRDLQGVLRHGHPGRRQQVRRAQHRGVVGRLVRLRAARACTSRSRCRPTSASTPRTWASSSAR